MVKAFLKEHKIDYLCHDPEPYPCGDIKDVYASIKDAGMFLPTKRTEGISTSDLIVRIVKDREEYTLRSLAKKYKPEEIGISNEYAEFVRQRAKVKKMSQKAVKSKDAELTKEMQKLQEMIEKLGKEMFTNALK